MHIQILGTGCPKCNKLANQVTKAATELELNFDMEKVTDINEITGFGIMMTPGLVVDGQVKFSGKVPSVEELKDILKSS